MFVGSLNKQITLQAPTHVSDSMGGFTTTYVTKATGVWASIWPIRANEIIRSAVDISTITHRIRIRYRRDIHTDWRILYGGKYYDIMVPPIDINTEHEIIELLCKVVE